MENFPPLGSLPQSPSGPCAKVPFGDTANVDRRDTKSNLPPPPEPLPCDTRHPRVMPLPPKPTGACPWRHSWGPLAPKIASSSSRVLSPDQLLTRIDPLVVLPAVCALGPYSYGPVLIELAGNAFHCRDLLIDLRLGRLVTGILEVAVGARRCPSIGRRPHDSVRARPGSSEPWQEPVRHPLSPGPSRRQTVDKGQFRRFHTPTCDPLTGNLLVGLPGFEPGTS